MPTMEETLHHIEAENILDVATGRGDFIHFLQDNLAAFGSATGIDVKQFEVWSKNGFDPRKIHFQVMDAAVLQFGDESFDLVSISNSLHHMPKPAVVLSEMIRVLKPGGVFLFYEMYTDRQTPPQQTHTLLHQWWGKIDTAAGIFHHSPYRRSELIQFLKETGISLWEYLDEADLSGDPIAPEVVEELKSIIDEYIDKTKETVLIAEGEQLRQRVQSVGFHSASQLFAIGKKNESLQV